MSAVASPSISFRSDGPIGPRFTLDGSDALERHLLQSCLRVLNGVHGIVPERRLEAVLLGGSYGRGEGGVFQTDHGDRAYSEMEFYVCVRDMPLGGRWHCRHALHKLAEQLAPQIGINIDLCLLSLARLRRSPIRLFYYDLVLGHRRLWGAADVLHGCEHHLDAHKLPLEEATHLLLNRCSGLLLAQERLRRENFGPVETDFVHRNHAKAKLALGDVVLAANGLYHWSCRDRHARLLGLRSGMAPNLPTLQRHHTDGVRFRLHPWSTSAPRWFLQREQDALCALALEVWCWLENRRLHADFHTAREYAFDPCNKFAPSSWWLNRMRTARAFGITKALSLRASRHPRERLLHALALLLWEPEVLQDPLLLKRVQAELATKETEFSRIVQRYESIWRQWR